LTLLCHPGHSQEHPDRNSTRAYLTGSSTTTTTEEEEEEEEVGEWRGFDGGEGQNGMRGVSSAAWIRGLEETCCWGKRFNRVYSNNCSGRRPSNGAYVKPLAGGSCRPSRLHER